ncbi:MAG: sulfotransferase [Pseudomonadales bacterium]|nr:sulfotransferase [Halioglobus sp.]MCP5129147.1 sulfotransferase [Pseudomonadales bacterium]
MKPENRAASTPAWKPLVEELKQALAVKDRAGANAAVTKLLDCRAPLGGHWRSFSELMRVSGELTLANRAMDAFVAAAGNTPQALYSKVVLLTQSGRMREAHDLISRLPPDVPDRAGHEYVMGNTAMTMGLTDEARERLLAAVKYRPGWGPAWLTLASTVNLARDPIGELLLADAGAAKQQGPGDLARYYYAVGKLHVDRDEADAAFAAYARGAKLLRQETPYSKKGNTRSARAAMTGFGDGFIETLNARKERDTSRPIFVTGLPRSGTTLVEHILASHSSVANGAELNLIQHMGVLAGGSSGEALQAYLGRGGSPDALATLYLHLMAERFGPTGRIVDKTIDASRMLGLIAAALPDAPLIWMRRDPLDSAWSCFRTFFIHGVAWSYSLTDIAHHFMLEDTLLAFWKERLGERLLVVPYPELVASPESWTRKLLAHCSLDEEPGVFTPHATERIVMTASAMQVRKPINRDGLNTAQPYRSHLQPFIDAYSTPTGRLE